MAQMLAAVAEGAESIPAERLPALLGAIEHARMALQRALLTPSPAGPQEDRLLTVEEAAERLSMTPDWLYRHADRLPFTVRVSPGQLRFSALEVQRYISRLAGGRG